MDLNLNGKQSQTLSPQTIQSMKILQMGSQELLEYITEAIQENPVLETSETGGPDEESAILRKKLEWLDSASRQERRTAAGNDEDTDSLANYGGAEVQEENLYFYLFSQLQLMKLPSDLMKAARGITENLNGNGYLDEPLEKLAEDLHMEKDFLENALKIVQSLEPAGIGARSLKECLRLQLERQEGDTTLAKEIVAKYLNALAKNKYTWIAKELSADPNEVRDACDLIRSLNPKPGSGFAGREQLNYITPELYVETFPTHFELTANDDFIPSLKISSYYTSLMKETQDEEVKEYLSEKVRQAKWVIKSIEQRRSTLLSCAECILKTQEAFFRLGPGHLSPMGLSDIASKLGVHESTVSRAIKGKYIQCSHGVYPMSFFFSRSLGRNSPDDSAVSPDAAKALLKKLVHEEDKRKPLSDQKLCAMMTAQGCPLSRRTVAKYRDELGIPATSVRKEYP